MARGSGSVTGPMDLSGRWHALVADEAIRRTWLDDGDPDDGWEAIDVPGHWRSVPAFADTDGPLLHRTRFEHSAPAGGDRAWLVLDGCFYQADVWLDGAYVGDTEGYFFPHAFEVTDALTARSDHVLGVELACSRPGDPDAQRNLTGSFQHGDWLDPAWNPGGIWRPVRIERSGPVRILHLRVLCTEATEERATVTVRAVLDAATAGQVRVRTTVAGVDHEEVHTVAAGENQIGWTVTVPDPVRWWPHALGDQPLHDVTVEVHVPVGRPDGGGGVDSETGASGAGASDAPGAADAPEVDETGDEGLGPTILSDRRERRIGLRQVAMRDWVLSVNGERLFLKGSNVGPARPDLGTTDPQLLRDDVDRAVDLGLDLLRVHSHVSRPELYDAADEAGLLLWQDLPLHGGFARTLRKQAVRQAREAVDLLGHHPSVAIWCGHDAPDGADEPTAVDGGGSRPRSLLRAVAGRQLPSWNRTILDRSIKRALARQDGTRPVVAHSGVAPHPPDLDGTDSHLYFGWRHGDERQLPGFARAWPRMVRFVSELGPQSVPPNDDFVEPGAWPGLDWERLAARHGMQRAAFDDHVPPGRHADYETWRRATQDYQASVVRRQVEELRRLKYRPTGGVAQFGFADAHPRISGSLLDHEREPKPAWEAMRAACRPVIVVADRLPPAAAPGDALALDVHVVNDRREPLARATVTVTAEWMGGGHTWRFHGDVDADSCARVGTVQFVVPDAIGPLALHLALVGRDGEPIADNVDRSTVLHP